MQPEEFFWGEPLLYQFYSVIRQYVQALGATTTRISKSQVAFRRRVYFALVWMPGKVLRGRTPPLVLTILFRERDPSPRWKQVVEAYPGRFTHHLELNEMSDIDEEVKTWLHKAWELAG